MKPWSLPLFVAVALLAPVALLFRFAVLVPLGVVIPAVRRFTWQRLSSLSINPEVVLWIGSFWKPATRNRQYLFGRKPIERSRAEMQHQYHP